MPKSGTPAAAKVEEPALHPFIGLYKGKQYESHAVSMYAAQKEIAKRVGARHDYDVSVYAATETEPLAAAIENEKVQPEETPGIEEITKVERKSKPSIESQGVAHIQQIPLVAPETLELKHKTKPSIEETTKPKLAKTIAAGSADILKAKATEKPSAANPKGKKTTAKIIKVHDEGTASIYQRAINEIPSSDKQEPSLDKVIDRLKATQGGQAASRNTHNVEKAGSTPAPATKSSAQPMREGHPISAAENRAIHAWYGEHGESNHRGKNMSKLTYRKREELKDSDFAIPEKRKYPIHNKAHARNALARVAQFGTSEEQLRVRKSVLERYPEIDEPHIQPMIVKTIRPIGKRPKLVTTPRRRHNGMRNLGAGIVESRTKGGRRRHLKLT